MTAGHEAEFASRQPAVALKPYIDRYIGYRLDGFPGGVHRGLPSRHLTMIVSIGDPIDVLSQTDPAQAPAAYQFVLSGLQTAPALIAAGDAQEGVAIELTPLGCRNLLGLPPVALWNTSFEARDVIGHAACELWERLHEHTRWEERFAACDAVLSRFINERHRSGPADQLRGAWELLAGTNGMLPVSDIAQRVGWTTRHLTQRFAAEFGLNPKVAARVLRFERACALLRSSQVDDRRRPVRPTLVDVAMACGYYDQPHFNRDFKQFAGCSPSEWLAAEFPFIQDSQGSSGQHHIYE